MDLRIGEGTPSPMITMPVEMDEETARLFLRRALRELPDHLIIGLYLEMILKQAVMEKISREELMTGATAQNGKPEDGEVSPTTAECDTASSVENPSNE